MVEMSARRASNRFENFLLFGSAFLKFNSGIEILGVLSHNNHIDIIVTRTQALVSFGRAEVSIEVKLFAQSHIRAARTFTYGGGNRTLQSNLRAFNRFYDLIG